MGGYTASLTAHASRKQQTASLLMQVQRNLLPPLSTMRLLWAAQPGSEEACLYKARDQAGKPTRRSNIDRFALLKGLLLPPKAGNKVWTGLHALFTFI